MNKTLSFLALHLSLFIMELLICFIILILIDISQYGIDSFGESGIRTRDTANHHYNTLNSLLN